VKLLLFLCRSILGKTKFLPCETIQIRSPFEPVEAKKVKRPIVDKPVEKTPNVPHSRELFPLPNIKTHPSTGFPQALQ
jgi:hypothetical protein